MVITLKVTLLRGRYCDGDWSANIELEESVTLVELHEAILRAVKFQNDHMCCFFLSRTDRSRSRVYFDDENEELFSRTLQEIFPLPPKQSLFYLFDWGDEWVFKVSPMRVRPREPVPGITYPRVASESGTQPVQYPSFDEDDEDFDEDDAK